MGVTSTLTRPYPKETWSVTRLNGVIIGRVEVQASRGGGDARQTTTSYRTGKHTVGISDADRDENDLLSSQTYGELRTTLYRQRDISQSSPFDNGHPFSTSKSWVDNFTVVTSENLVGGDKYAYDGPVVPVGIPYGRFVTPASFDAAYYGTKGIANTAPTQPIVSSLTALIELQREGLPSLLGAQIRRLRQGGFFANLAREFLSLEFGYKPLARDIAMAAAACAEASQLLQQYARDSGENGKHVRRKWTFEPQHTVTPRVKTRSIVATLSNSSGVKPWVLPSGAAASQLAGDLYCTETSSRRIWFSGAYMYHSGLSSRQSSFEDIYERANHLLGIELTPDVVYSVTPWSWLLDWNVNVGDVIKNISSFQTDGLVLRYGYVMCETQTTRDYTLVPDLKPLSGPPGPFTISYITLKKERVKASPYGFALNPNAYSTRQWAILSALGLSKGGPNSLP